MAMAGVSKRAHLHTVSVDVAVGLEVRRRARVPLELVAGRARVAAEVGHHRRRRCQKSQNQN